MKKPLHAVKLSDAYPSKTPTPSAPTPKENKALMVIQEKVMGENKERMPIKDNDNVGRNEVRMPVTGETKNPGVWHENPYQPTQPHLLGTKEQEDRFLVVLAEKKYLCWAAPAFGCSRMTVNRRMQENPEFASAVYDVIACREEMMLATIEAVSESEAVKTGRNTDRAMQLNALGYGKYKRDSKGPQVATQINIMIGFTPPKHRGT